MFHPTLKIKIYQEDLVFGPGLVILMEHILVTESMKDACGEMGMSYSKGWKIINRAEKELGFRFRIARKHRQLRVQRCSGCQLIDFFNSVSPSQQLDGRHSAV